MTHRSLVYLLALLSASMVAQGDLETDYPNVHRFVGPSHNVLAESGVCIDPESVAGAAMERTDPELARRNWEGWNPILAAAGKHQDSHPERFGPHTPLEEVLSDLDRELGQRQRDAVRGTSYPMSRKYNPDAFFARTDEEITARAREAFQDELTEQYGPHPSDAEVTAWAEQRATERFRDRAIVPLRSRVVSALNAAATESMGVVPPPEEPTRDLQALGLLPLVPSLAVFVHHVETMEGDPTLYTEAERAALLWASGAYRVEAGLGDLPRLDDMIAQDLREVEDRRFRALDIAVRGVSVAVWIGALVGVVLGVRRWRSRRRGPVGVS